MNDEERLDYMIYRSERDIFRPKPKASRPPRRRQGKKAVVDRVLDKAVEHLKRRSARRRRGRVAADENA